jgi:hypothetical protein
VTVFCVFSAEVTRERITRVTRQLQSSSRRVGLYRVHGSDYRISKCDTADGSNCETVNCVNVRASGINSLCPQRSEVICRVTYPTRDNILYNITFSDSKGLKLQYITEGKLINNISWTVCHA